ncbi:paraquat-inducible protein A [Frigidibacter sp. RF13]|uniref:paraquat-inducible protein A n=1 Tax=Frigidibacter sp. RF13 TaxID=2997340 RepID=UPI00226DAAAD|nr:paraquat-inducible protein A [Frigidibacter sp. RF13]MCY1125847.1 paraquat-inducible protein A [Frigidibacter sp. RF13]
MRGLTPLALANFALLILFPLSWVAPLLRAGWLPFFELDEISVLTGLQAIWEKDALLALLVTFLALFAPMAKTLGLALIHFRLASPRLLPILETLGRLAMADVFLIALYIVLAKGAFVGRLETAWGLYLFTACILASLWISSITSRRLHRA